jgi:hypothetical protein
VGAFCCPPIRRLLTICHTHTFTCLQNGATALYHAAKHGHAGVVGALLEAGASGEIAMSQDSDWMVGMAATVRVRVATGCDSVIVNVTAT